MATPGLRAAGTAQRNGFTAVRKTNAIHMFLLTSDDVVKRTARCRAFCTGSAAPLIFRSVKRWICGARGERLSSSYRVYSIANPRLLEQSTVLL
jgi:hypothetical protein